MRSKELAKFMPYAVTGVRKALDAGLPADVAPDAQILIDGAEEAAWKETNLPPLAVQWIRAAQVLERIGTPEAIALLESISENASSPMLWLEADTVLRRMRSKPATGK